MTTGNSSKTQISKHQKVAAAQLVREREYWTGRFGGEFERSAFPPAGAAGAGDGKGDAKHPVHQTVDFGFKSDLTQRLVTVSSGEPSNLHMILVTALAVLLSKYTGLTDITLGTSIDKQDDDARLINTILPLRIGVPGEMTFKGLLLEVRQIIVDAFEHQNYPVETLIPSIKPGSSDGEFPLFDVSLVLENIQDRKYLDHIHQGMCFVFRLLDGVLQGEVSYCPERYSAEMVRGITNHFTLLLGDVLFYLERKIGDIDLVGGEERGRLLNFSGPPMDYPDITMDELFRRSVEKAADKIAVVDADSGASISYRELDRRSRELAGRLKGQGVGEGTVVAIVAERSIETMIGILGILTAGAAFLPIDPDTPRGRKQYMLSDSGAGILLTGQDVGQDVGRDIGQPIAPCFPGPDRPAYIIYTSGSSGRPRGVVVEHRSLVNYTCWAAREYVEQGAVNFPLFTSPAFDLTVTSIFTPLATGNTIVVYGDWGQGNLVERIMNDPRVGIIKLTPAHLELIGEPDGDGKNRNGKNIGGGGVKRMIVGGDKLSVPAALAISNHFNGGIEIYNEYGPTEATVGCMVHRFDPRSDTGDFVSIGVPAPNHRVYLLDGRLKPVPGGVAGEIMITGTGVARGYLNNPGLTHDKFNAAFDRSVFGLSPGAVLYKTGDLARWQPNGHMEFLGRRDFQVKVRGYRIEPGEIEHRLLGHPDVRSAVVVPRRGAEGELYLCAYIAVATDPSAGDASTTSLREYLLETLPHYMIPGYFVHLERMPLTPHGKVDRNALPGPEPTDAGVEYQPPSTEKERILVEIWRDVLGMENPGINDNYFNSGGDSIKAIQVAARLQKHRLKLELQDLFRYSTIKQLATRLKSTRLNAPQGIIEGPVKLTPVQEWFFEEYRGPVECFNQSVVLYRREGFDRRVLERVFAKWVEHHDALRLVFEVLEKEKGGQIGAFNRGVSGSGVDICHFDLRDITERRDYMGIIREKAAGVLNRMDLARAPLVKIGLFQTFEGDYLVIVIHHLVVDGVSWRILLEDFNSFYRQIERGRQPGNMELPLKTTPYKEWAEKLRDYADSEALLKEMPYWREIEQTHECGDDAGGLSPGGGTRELSLELEEVYTTRLLKGVHHAFNTEINDILLAALAMALPPLTGGNRTVIHLEGHGREEIIGGINISRTVGWFTSIYPVVLTVPRDGDLSTLIKSTKEMLRRIPNKGIGYGILKYLTVREHKGGHKEYPEFRLKPRISFNYLGQVDEDLKSDLFRVVDLSVDDPGAAAPPGENIYPLYINGMIAARRLKISVTYDESAYDEGSVLGFIKDYGNALRQIIDLCGARDEVEPTASDFTSPMEEQEVDMIFDALGQITVEDEG